MSTPFSRTTRSLALDNSRFIIVILTLTGVAFAVWIAWFTLSRVTLHEVTQRARLEVSAATREVSSVQSGRVVVSNLIIGQQVRSGDILVELDARAPTLRLEEAQRQLGAIPFRAQSLRREITALTLAMNDADSASQAALRSAAEQLRQAEGARRFADDNARRTQNDALSGGASQVEALKARSDANRALSARNASAADITKLRYDFGARGGQTQAQIEALSRNLIVIDAEAQSIRNQMTALRLEIENRFVRAPIDGVIGEALPLGTGAYVPVGQRLASIVPRGDLIVTAKFDPTTALGRLRKGQKARFRLDGFPWTQYGSVAARVNRVASETRDRMLHVEFALERPPASGIALRHGMTGTIEVDLESVSPATLLLRSSGYVGRPTGANGKSPL